MHLRPADFFASNPALDVPSSRNQASVLVPFCGQQSKGEAAGKEDAQFKARTVPVQETPFSHLQSGASDVDAKQAGANVEESANGENDALGRRLSRAAQRLLGPKNKDSHKS